MGLEYLETESESRFNPSAEMMDLMELSGRSSGPLTKENVLPMPRAFVS